MSHVEQGVGFHGGWVRVQCAHGNPPGSGRLGILDPADATLRRIGAD